MYAACLEPFFFRFFRFPLRRGVLSLGLAGRWFARWFSSRLPRRGPFLRCCRARLRSLMESS